MLCTGSAPEQRNELMAEYRRLAEAGRIEFVTFHQSLQPMRSSSKGSGPSQSER